MVNTIIADNIYYLYRCHPDYCQPLILPEHKQSKPPLVDEPLAKNTQEDIFSWFPIAETR
ncbi:hypothetical protein [Cylindrospermum stagnale]|uniref:hypothetical protein n=1 Tax=Cylindrospermum stagnale TaxID=142864 RepID=UPI0012F6B89B|nr:hypothetical protein [Cylindrospermum stagnale]